MGLLVQFSYIGDLKLYSLELLLNNSRNFIVVTILVWFYEKFHSI